ncbi:MAG: sensor histidine kinase, partial [Mycobacteriales bacterium]
LAGARALLTSGELSAATEQVAEAEDQVRAVMARTRPPALRDGDLAAAVAVLRDDVAHRYGLAVALRWPEEPRPLPLATAVTVYRFFQEAVLNVVKHADVAEAALRLAFDEDGLTAEVADRGPGFDPAAVKSERGRHVGLGLLAERARLAGGWVDVDSTPGVGTVLRLRLPAPPGEADRGAALRVLAPGQRDHSRDLGRQPGQGREQIADGHQVGTQTGGG